MPPVQCVSVTLPYLPPNSLLWTIPWSRRFPAPPQAYHAALPLNRHRASDCYAFFVGADDLMLIYPASPYRLAASCPTSPPDHALILIPIIMQRTAVYRPGWHPGRILLLCGYTGKELKRLAAIFSRRWLVSGSVRWWRLHPPDIAMKQHTVSSRSWLASPSIPLILPCLLPFLSPFRAPPFHLQLPPSIPTQRSFPSGLLITLCGRISPAR